MEEINLGELLKFFISKLKYIILAVELCIIGGFVYVQFLLTPMYHSSTTLILVSDTSQQNSATIQSEVNLNKNLVTTYSEIVKSRAVLSEVIKELKLSEDVSSLQKKISVSSVENTEIIKIQVSDKDNKNAQKIANTTAKVFMKQVKKIYNLTNVSTIDSASLEKSPYNVHLIKQLFIAAFIGLVGSMGIVFLFFYFDTTIKSSKDIEDKIGLPVVGSVPIIKKGE